MATTQETGEENARCPLCDDYRGPPSSVEAHISRKTDPVHQGEVGRAHRGDLERQVENTSDVESTEDPSIDGFLAGVGSSDSGDQEDGEMPTDEEYQNQQERLRNSSEESDSNEQGDGSEVEQAESAASGIGIDPITLMTVVGAAVLLYVLYKTVIGGSSSGQAPELEESVGEESAGDEVPTDGGLVG